MLTGQNLSQILQTRLFRRFSDGLHIQEFHFDPGTFKRKSQGNS